ncbi:MAG: DUF2339 domain-containing protein [Treponema sp.]|jgi:uncharacterized membrane protein|nr:DUF2339 domain-containing protein [Treponema sp.]
MDVYWAFGLLFFVILSAFLFAVIAAVYLLWKTGRLTGIIEEQERRIALLEQSALHAGKTADCNAEKENPVLPGESLQSGQMEAVYGESTPDVPADISEQGAVYEGPQFPVNMKAEACMEEAEVAGYGERTDPLFQESIAAIPEDSNATLDGADRAADQTAVPPSEASGISGMIGGFVRGGNLWAAGGVILITAAFGMLITYLTRHGFFTVEMGIAGAALSGIVLIVLGWQFRLKRPSYFLILQGGGIGILYLSVFAAHKLTPYFSAGASIVLMSVLVPPAIVLSLVQASQPLAIFGFLGGFAAPVLLASPDGNPIFLFSYYLALNLGVLAIAFRRNWKGLSLLSFFCTFLPLLFIDLDNYFPRLFWVSELFVLAYIVLFTVLGIHSAGKERIKLGSIDAVLLLGTPFLGAILEWRMFSFIPHGHAIICLFFSAFYLLVCLAIWKHIGKSSLILAEGFLALAVLLANIALPLELSPEAAGAVWAAEGILVFLYGLRIKDFRIILCAFILHAASAIIFITDALHVPRVPYRVQTALTEVQPWRSGSFIGSLIIALSAFAMLVLGNSFANKNYGERGKIQGTDRLLGGLAGLEFKTCYPGFSVITLIWALCWWLGAWFFELERLSFTYRQPPVSTEGFFFIICSVTALLGGISSRFFRCPILSATVIPGLLYALGLILGAVFSGFFDYYALRIDSSFTVNYFEDFYLAGWLIFFAAEVFLIVFLRKVIKPALRAAWLFGFILIGVTVISSQTRYSFREWQFGASWVSFAGVFPLLGTVIMLSRLAPVKNLIPDFLRLERAGGNPEDWGQGSIFFQNKKLLCGILPALLCSALGIWFLVTLFLSGNPSPLPLYLPILSPLDLEEGFCIAVFLYWQQCITKAAVLDEGLRKIIMPMKAVVSITDTAVFLWITAIIVRSVHFFGEFPLYAVIGTGEFRLAHFIFLALYGIVHIIAGHRLSLRPVWIAGVVLIAADIAKLILLDLANSSALVRIASFFIGGLILLFIGWAAPLPPERSKAEDDEGNRHNTEI